MYNPLLFNSLFWETASILSWSGGPFGAASCFLIRTLLEPLLSLEEKQPNVPNLEFILRSSLDEIKDKLANVEKIVAQINKELIIDKFEKLNNILINYKKSIIQLYEKINIISFNFEDLIDYLKSEDSATISPILDLSRMADGEEPNSLKYIINYLFLSISRNTSRDKQLQREHYFFQLCWAITIYCIVKIQLIKLSNILALDRRETNSKSINHFIDLKSNMNIWVSQLNKARSVKTFSSGDLNLNLAEQIIYEQLENIKLEKIEISRNDLAVHSQKITIKANGRTWDAEKNCYIYNFDEFLHNLPNYRKQYKPYAGLILDLSTYDVKIEPMTTTVAASKYILSVKAIAHRDDVSNTNGFSPIQQYPRPSEILGQIPGNYSAYKFLEQYIFDDYIIDPDHSDPQVQRRILSREPYIIGKFMDHFARNFFAEEYLQQIQQHEHYLDRIPLRLAMYFYMANHKSRAALSVALRFAFRALGYIVLPENYIASSYSFFQEATQILLMKDEDVINDKINLGYTARSGNNYLMVNFDTSFDIKHFLDSFRFKKFSFLKGKIKLELDDPEEKAGDIMIEDFWEKILEKCRLNLVIPRAPLSNPSQGYWENKNFTIESWKSTVPEKSLWFIPNMQVRYGVTFVAPIAPSNAFNQFASDLTFLDNSTWVAESKIAWMVARPTPDSREEPLDEKNIGFITIKQEEIYRCQPVLTNIPMPNLEYENVENIRIYRQFRCTSNTQGNSYLAYSPRCIFSFSKDKFEQKGLRVRDTVKKFTDKESPVQAPIGEVILKEWGDEAKKDSELWFRSGLNVRYGVSFANEAGESIIKWSNWHECLKRKKPALGLPDHKDYPYKEYEQITHINIYRQFSDRQSIKVSRQICTFSFDQIPDNFVDIAETNSNDDVGLTVRQVENSNFLWTMKKKTELSEVCATEEEIHLSTATLPPI